MRGFRCLEIDCFDGADGEPIVYHGRTLTGKVNFKSVVFVIGKYAFMVSLLKGKTQLKNKCINNWKQE